MIVYMHVATDCIHACLYTPGCYYTTKADPKPVIGSLGYKMAAISYAYRYAYTSLSDLFFPFIVSYMYTLD